MDDKINNMKPEDIHAAEFIIQGKAEIRQWPQESVLINAEHAMFYFQPGKRFYFYIRIVNNIGKIVKMPLAIKTVGVNSYQNN
jgi:predicted phage tail protein